MCSIETEFDEEKCNSDNEIATNDEQLPADTLCIALPTKMSWLVECILRNLGVKLATSASVRIPGIYFVGMFFYVAFFCRHLKSFNCH